MYTITRYRHSLSILFYFIPTTKVAVILIRSIQGSEWGATPLAPHLCTLEVGIKKDVLRQLETFTRYPSS